MVKIIHHAGVEESILGGSISNIFHQKLFNIQHSMKIHSECTNQLRNGQQRKT